MSYDPRLAFEQIQQLFAADPRRSLLELSTTLALDRHTITRAVRAATGVTFEKWRERELYRLICDLLAEDTLRSIKEIAFRVGYSSPRALCRFVLRMSACTPTRLRAQLRESLPESDRQSLTTATSPARNQNTLTLQSHKQRPGSDQSVLPVQFCTKKSTDSAGSIFLQRK